MEKINYQFIKDEITKRINTALNFVEVQYDCDGKEVDVEVYGKPNDGNIYDIEAVMQVVSYYGLNAYVGMDRHDGYLLPTLRIFE